MREHKNLKGKISHERVEFINRRLDVLDSVKRGVYEYLCLGRTFRQINVSSNLLIPALRQAAIIHATGDAKTLTHRFLYTNEFNPWKKAS